MRLQETTVLYSDGRRKMVTSLFDLTAKYVDIARCVWTVNDTDKIIVSAAQTVRVHPSGIHTPH